MRAQKYQEEYVRTSWKWRNNELILKTAGLTTHDFIKLDSPANLSTATSFYFLSANDFL